MSTGLLSTGTGFGIRSRPCLMAVQLTATEYGEGPPVAILHGLFGSGRNWRSIAQQLAVRHRVLAFDLRNHGDAHWADEMAYGELVEDLRASLRARHRPRCPAGPQHGRKGRDARGVALPQRDRSPGGRRHCTGYQSADTACLRSCDAGGRSPRCNTAWRSRCAAHWDYP